MKKNKRILILAILGIFLLGLISCGTPKPKDVVDAYFTEIKKGEQSKSNEFIKNSLAGNNEEASIDKSVDSLSKETEDLILEAFKNLKYEINSENIEKDKATVNVTVEGANITMAIVDSIKEGFQKMLSAAFTNPDISEDEIAGIMNDVLLDKLKNASNDKRDGDITLNKTKDGWTIEENTELYRIVLGDATN